MAAPIPKSAATLSMTLTATAASPEKRANGTMGIEAPTAKSPKEYAAAPHAEPPSSSGSMPSSSLARVSSAVPRSETILAARARAWASGRPFAW